MKRLLGALAVSTVMVSGLVTTAHAADVVVKVREDRAGDVQTKSRYWESERATRRVKQSVDIRRATYLINRERPVPTLRAVMKIKEVLPARHQRKQQFATEIEWLAQPEYNRISATGFGAPKVTHTSRGGTRVISCPRARARVFPARNVVVHVVPLRCLTYTGQTGSLQSSAIVKPNDPDRIVARDWTRWIRDVGL